MIEAPLNASAPKVMAVATSAIASGSSRGRRWKASASVATITSSAASNSSRSELVIAPVRSATITGSPVTR